MRELTNALVCPLFDAWKKCILSDYVEQRINSEGGLLASFYSHLKAILPDSNCLLIQPVIKVVGKRYFPDLLIRNSGEVIAIVELKYMPRVKARMKKDVRILCELAKTTGKSTSAMNAIEDRAPRRSHIIFQTTSYLFGAECMPN